MGNDFVKESVRKIMEGSEFEGTKKSAMAVAWMLANLKGHSLKVIDVQGKSSLADYFVLASALNPVQAQTMADTVSRELKKYKVPTLSVEGRENPDWLLVDLGDVVVHIFLETTRDLYALDELWTEGRPVEIPRSYYFGLDDDIVVEPEEYAKKFV